MKRVEVVFQIEGSTEIEVPDEASEAEVEKIAREAVRREAGHLSIDIANFEVLEPECDR